ncbi:MSMEG_0570 family nitrogen starvation response protein [Nodosilinea nodulosa]|uniref:MSMEG_0570 family nitrogen starvation response protein n=1 Tax=Nodosilinea nodulosa TaxID=416001 RepID=UPI00031F6EAA|nr:MSMEG_0570 family nitrogen starvation response protein [Nodosilinea nodulosa]
MPEIRFQIQWPDGSQDTCYSPSLVVKDYFEPATAYSLADFVERSRTALTIASDRVQAKYGMPCGLALGQLRQIEATASRYDQLPGPTVTVLQFLE